MYSSAEDAMYHPVTIKDQRFWKRILIVDDDVDVTVTFKVGIQDSNNSADVNKRIEVYTSNDPLDQITAIEQGLEEEFLEVITDHQ